MPCELLSASLSESELATREFYDHWIGATGVLSVIGRLIFRLSGVAYAPTFIRAGRLTSIHSVLEIGCGMGTILRATKARLSSTAIYLGIDLSPQMILQGRSKASNHCAAKHVELLVGSGLLLPLCDSHFDVVLISHVVKYLTDEQFSDVLWEARRVMRRGGRIVLWEFHPVVIPSITRLILRCCKAQKLRAPAEMQDALKRAGFSDLRQFRVITPWLPWSNVAFTGHLD